MYYYNGIPTFGTLRSVLYERLSLYLSEGQVPLYVIDNAYGWDIPAYI